MIILNADKRIELKNYSERLKYRMFSLEELRGGLDDKDLSKFILNHHLFSFDKLIEICCLIKDESFVIDCLREHKRQSVLFNNTDSINFISGGIDFTNDSVIIRKNEGSIILTALNK